MPAKRRAAGPAAPQAARILHRMPRIALPVTVVLPLRDPAPGAARRCLDALARLDPAPAEVLVVESNARDPASGEDVARHCARLGPRFRFVSLGAWPGGREGALNLALRDAAAGSALVGVVEVRTRPDAGWLDQAERLLADPALALLATPVAGLQQPRADGFFPDGALLLARRDALRAVGGWRPGPAAEEELAPRLMRAGWEVAVADRPAARRQSSGAHPHRAAQRAAGVRQAIRHHAGAVLHPWRRQLAASQRRRLLAAWSPSLADGLARLTLLVAIAWSAALLVADAPAPPAMPFLAAALLPLAFTRRCGLEAIAAAGAAGRAMLGARDGGGAAEATLAALVFATAATVLGWPPDTPGQGPWLATLATLGAPALAALARPTSQRAEQAVEACADGRDKISLGI